MNFINYNILLVGNKSDKRVKRFAKNLRYLRKQRNLTQEEVAAALQLGSGTTVSQYERGRNLPPSILFYEICNFFHLPDISYLTELDLESEGWTSDFPVVSSAPNKVVALQRLAHFEEFTDELLNTLTRFKQEIEVFKVELEK